MSGAYSRNFITYAKKFNVRNDKMINGEVKFILILKVNGSRVAIFILLGA